MLAKFRLSHVNVNVCTLDKVFAQPSPTQLELQLICKVRYSLLESYGRYCVCVSVIHTSLALHMYVVVVCKLIR